jgi:segregation and condensation protein A
MHDSTRVVRGTLCPVTLAEANGPAPGLIAPIPPVPLGSVAMMTIDVDTPVFRGPFDLLLHLILRDDVDIYEVNLAKIVDEFLAEIERMQDLDLDVATSFLLIAATLVELKARRLLPDMGDVDLDDELALWEERDLLLARLLEAKTFKDVAAVLARLADDADRCFARTAGPDERFAAMVPDLLAGTDANRLQAAAIRALTPRPVPIVDLFHVDPIRITVGDAVAELIDELPRTGTVSFRQLTSALADRIEVIVRFLAVLELFKQGAVELEQVGRFGDITIAWIAADDFDTDEVLVDAYEG